MIPNINIQKVLLGLAAVSLISACQGSSDQPPVFRATPSHQASAKEKTVVVPPDVTKAWRAVKIAVIDKSRATENIYTVPIGGSFRVPTSNLMIYIEAFLPSFVMEGSNITSSSNELKNPGVKVRISDKEADIYSGWLFSNFPNTHAFMHPKFGFTLVDVVPVSAK